MHSYKKLENLIVECEIQPNETDNSFSHSTYKIKKKLSSDPSRESTWYLKRHANLQSAAREAVVQNLFAFILGYHPKVRIVTSDSGEFFVISKEIKGQSLATINADVLKQGFANGIFTGLGKVLLLCLFFNDIDSKLANL